MDSPECVISSSNCETPPFTNNLSQLYRTHTETKGKPLPCSLPLPSPVRKGFIRAGSTGEGGSRRGELSSPAAGLFSAAALGTVGRVVLRAAWAGRAQSTPENPRLPRKGF